MNSAKDFPTSRDGLSHSEISGSMCVCHYPKLIAAYHVLLRHPMPRHPPCTLIILIHFLVFDETLISLYVLHQQNICQRTLFSITEKTTAKYMPLFLQAKYQIFSFSLKGSINRRLAILRLPQKLACLALIRHSFQFCAR